MLEDESRKDPAKYEEFYKQFGIYIKEGVVSDPKNSGQLAKLLRYESSATEKGKLTTLDDYVSRMKENQTEIYYLYSSTREHLEAGPHLEAFKVRGLEVLYLYEPADEFVMTGLGKFEGKPLVSADNAGLELGEAAPGQAGEALAEAEAKSLCDWLKETLGDSVNEVSVSRRLVDSPAIALNADKYMTPSMRRMMKAMKKDADIKYSVNLEINPGHKLVKNLAGLKDKDPDTARLIAAQLLDNALIAAGFLEDPRSMVERLNLILERMAEK
jgi:molecular chaperone HtpG